MGAQLLLSKSLLNTLRGLLLLVGFAVALTIAIAPTKAQAYPLGWCTTTGIGEFGCFSSPGAACVAQHAGYNPDATYYGYQDYTTWAYKQCMWAPGGTAPTLVEFECSDGVHETAYPPGQCIDNNYQLGMCTAGQATPTTPNPIDILTGNKSFEATDFQTIDKSLVLHRIFSSLPFGGLQTTLISAPIGLGNWLYDFQYELQIGSGWFPTGSELITLTTPSGPGYTFQRQSDGSMTPYLSGSYQTPQTNYTLAFVGTWPSDLSTLTSASTTWTLHDAQNNIWTLTTMINPTITSSGSPPPVYNIARPTQMVEPNGLTWTFTYGTSAELLSVTDSHGKTISFTWQYDTNASTGQTIPRAIIQANLPGGYTLKYGYAGIGGTSEADVLTSEQLYDPTSTLVDQTTYQLTNTGFPYSITNVINADSVNQWTVTYDASGRATSNQGADSAYGYSVSYDDSGSTFSRTVTNPLGKQTVYNFSTSPQFGLTSIDGLASTHCPASTSSLAYGTDGFVDQTTDENENLTQYTRNSRGLPTQTIEAYGTSLARTTNITWDPVNDVPTETVQPGLTTDLQYSSTGSLQQVTKTDTTTNTVPYSTNGQQRIWYYNWSSSGQLTSVEGPLGTADTTNYSYDPTTGYLASVTNPLSQVTQITSYDYRGDPTTIIDPNGVTSDLAYDGLGRLTTITTNPGGSEAVTTISYDAVGDVTKLTLPNGSYLMYNYDPARRVTSVVDNLGNSRTYVYNALGEATSADVSNSSSTIVQEQSTAYDELGRIINLVNAESQTTVLGYDLDSNMTSITDPTSNNHTYSFDGLNRLITDTDPSHYATQIGYDGQNNVISVQDPRLTAYPTTYVRDGFGDVTQGVSPDTGTTVYWYDLEGRLTKRVDSASQETDFAHDLVGRLTTKTFPADTSENITQTYDSTSGGNDGIGHLTSVADQSGSAAFTYNALGQLTTDARTIQSKNYTIGYTYDGAGKVLTMTYPSGRVVTFARDANGNISGVTTTSGATVVSGVTYQPFNGPNALTFGNGVALAIGYNLDGLVSSIQAANGTLNIQNLSYGYDDNENIHTITDSLTSARSQTLGYDPLYRLNAATGAYGTQAYTYDGVGNRLSGPTSATSYSYAPTANQVSTITSGSNTRSFVYNATGTTQSDVRNPSNTYSYTYNQDNRLVTAALNGTAVGAYVYNAFGQRAVKTASGATTHFLYDGQGHLIAEANGSTGAILREYIWLDTMPVAMVDETGGTPVVYYIHTDQLGTPQKVTDGSANVVWDGTFDPFGNAIASTGADWGTGLWGGFTWEPSSPETMLLRFPGQYADTETALNQNWFRDYDPTIGRYVESDPIGLWGGLNTYGYVEANPLAFHDWRGLAPGDRCNVIPTCSLDEEQILGGPMDGYSACNYKCTDGSTRSFITETGKCPRIVYSRDRRFNKPSLMTTPPLITGKQAAGAIAGGTAAWGLTQLLEYLGFGAIAF